MYSAQCTGYRPANIAGNIMPGISSLVEDALKRAAELGELPAEDKLASEEDDELAAIVHERLAAPQRMQVRLADL